MPMVGDVDVDVYIPTNNYVPSPTLLQPYINEAHTKPESYGHIANAIDYVIRAGSYHMSII